MKLNKKLKTFALTTSLTGIMAAAPIAAHAELGNESLHQGNWSPDVKALQQVLSDKGYYNQSATGYYGEDTKDAVISFQENHGLKANGATNKATYAAMNAKSYNINEKPLLWKDGDKGRASQAIAKAIERSPIPGG